MSGPESGQDKRADYWDVSLDGPISQCVYFIFLLCWRWCWFEVQTYRVCKKIKYMPLLLRNHSTSTSTLLTPFLMDQCLLLCALGGRILKTDQFWGLGSRIPYPDKIWTFGQRSSPIRTEIGENCPDRIRENGQFRDPTHQGPFRGPHRACRLKLAFKTKSRLISHGNRIIWCS